MSASVAPPPSVSTRISLCLSIAFCASEIASPPLLMPLRKLALRAACSNFLSMFEVTIMTSIRPYVTLETYAGGLFGPMYSAASARLVLLAKKASGALGASNVVV